MPDQPHKNTAPTTESGINPGEGFGYSGDNVMGKYSSQIDALFTEFDKPGSPGCIVAAIKAGRVIHQRAYGVANIEFDISFDQNTVLRMGSTSKHLCAAAVFFLVQKGKIKLECDIREYLPELPEYKDTVTIAHLLSMTSGMPDGLGLTVFAGLPLSFRLTRRQVIKLQTGFNSLMFKPGEDYCYSNTNYALLSEIIERVSGEDLETHLRKQIFSPLEMDSTGLVPDALSVIPNKATGYEKTDVGYKAGLFLSQLGGEGGIDTTITDFIKWFLHYRKDRQASGALTEFLEHEVTLGNGRISDYRYGMMVNQYCGLTKVSHPGGMPGYLCDFTFYPDQDFGFLLLANLSDSCLLEMSDRVADIVLNEDIQRSQHLIPVETIPADQKDFDEMGLSGGYACVDSGYLMEFVDGKCYLMGEEVRLLRKNENTLVSAKRSIAAEIYRVMSGKEDKGLWGLRLGGLDTQVLQSIEVEHMPNLTAYPGEYYSDVLRETHTVYEKDGRLNIKTGGVLRALLWQELQYCAGEVFAAPVDSEPSLTNISIRFVTGDNNEVVGFFYTAARVKGLYFEKRNLK